MGMAETDEQDAAQAKAAEIIAGAEVLAAALVEDAELRARERADEVLTQYQARLDVLLEEERAVRERLAELGESRAPRADVSGEEGLVDDRDALNGIDVRPDSSLAEFMKTTVRDEVKPAEGR